MAATRAFAALLDQDSVVLIEYQQEKAGFRLVDSRSRMQHFATPEAAVDAVIALLDEVSARKASLSIVLQHFGSFFHTLVLPPATPDVVRPIIEREIQRSFNIADPAFAYTMGEPLERRDPARAGGPPPSQVFIAGAPHAVIEALQARFARAKVRVDGVTVAPEVFRQLYDALDGSKEATAMLVCLHNGPHVAFFVNGRLELAIEPPPTLEGEAPLDTSVIIDQLERGAIFLRQQARGAVATRLLLSAPADEYESLASTIEARTGMHVAMLGEGIGSPEAVVAMGAVIAARATNALDLYPRPPAFDERLKRAMTGPPLVASAMLAAAAVAAFWAGMQVLRMERTRSDLEQVQQRVERAVPEIASARRSAEGRERIASIRTALDAANAEKAAATRLLANLGTGWQGGTQLDSLRLLRVEKGLAATVFGQATASTGPAAMGSATALYRHFQAASGLTGIRFESEYVPRVGNDPSAVEILKFSISTVAPVGAK
jgi:hypothetical protein